MGDFEAAETVGRYKNCYVINNSYDEKVKIHFILKDAENSNSETLILSPGLWEPAERAFPLFDALDFRCISVSYRGRGKSGTPANGYNLQHHVSDFKTVVDAVNPGSFILLAFSRGVGYACGYLAENREKVKAFIIVDHPPVHVKPWPGYAEFWKNLVYLGHPLPEFIRPSVLDALEKEADEVVFWNLLAGLDIPVFVLRGVSKTAKIPSDISEDDMSNYKKYVKNLKVIDFEYSGHMIVDEELGKYRLTIEEIVNSL